MLCGFSAKKKLSDDRSAPAATGSAEVQGVTHTQRIHTAERVQRAMHKAVDSSGAATVCRQSDNLCSTEASKNEQDRVSVSGRRQLYNRPSCVEIRRVDHALEKLNAFAPRSMTIIPGFGDFCRGHDEAGDTRVGEIFLR